MSPRVAVLPGERFGRVVAVSESEPVGPKKVRAFNCRCDCGKEFVAILGNLRSGGTESCGCQVGIRVTHPVDQETLKKLYYYDPCTGIFTRLTTRGLGAAGEEKASTSHGYIVLNINSKNYPAHRLAWLYMTGEYPIGEVDHRDQDRANNKWNNLRTVTSAQNKANVRKRKNNKSGFRGVSPNGTSGKPWCAFITINKKAKNLGYYDTPEAAAHAYDAKAREVFGEFGTYNFPLAGERSAR